MNISKHTAKLKLLYVECDEETVASTLHIIKDLFLEVVVAKSTIEAIELYKKYFSDTHHYYDIILSNVDMPNMNGLKMCKEIKEFNKNQVIAVTTTSSDSKYYLDAIGIGVDNFILKPILSLESIKHTLIDLAKKTILQNKLNNKEFLLRQKKKIIDKHVYFTSSDINGKITDISKAYLDFTGYKMEEVIGKNHSIFRNQDLDNNIVQNLWDTILKDRIWVGELKNNKSSGEEYWINTTITPLYNEENVKIGYTSIKEDITNQKRLEELSIKDPLTMLYNKRNFDYFIKKELKNSIWKKENFALLLIEIDYYTEFKNTYGNAKADNALIKISSILNKYTDSKTYNIFKISEEEFAVIILNKDDAFIENFSYDLLNSIEALKIDNCQSNVSKYLTATIGGVNLDTILYNISNNNLYNIADANLNQAKLNGRNNILLKIDHSYVEKLKNIDRVTKLPNRIALLQDISVLQEEAMLVLLHINQLNSLKDIYGDKYATDLVIQKSKELLYVLKEEEASLYSLNLNEFAILVTNKKLFEKYFSLLIHSILMPNDEDENSISTNILADFTAGVSYGILNVFNHADIVLQDAIISKENYKIYSSNQTAKQLQKDNLDRLSIYKNALHKGKIIPYFQPIIDTLDNSIIKYEALARLETDDGEIISPYYFLDSAKEDKTFEFFTRQMMQKVFNVFEKNDVNMSINLTYENITSKTMLEYIKNRLNKYGGDGITFEIVESEDILDYKRIKEFISMVKEFGCKISIDDFGSGYSNFTNITQLDIDYIKLDGSLIEKINIDLNIKHMIKGIISYSKNANIKTIAEYVSTKELDDSVRELGIDYIQGYYYGEPKSADSYGLL
ncbi:EAL domain-containing protein [Candidatus Sulfurimonas baltica]|uniref:EAL domain-containing protein n=1 Tax=Candidatus Sulfurimonas baltica TaxID=2740404 RepID=A0A7S7RM82_9BACT|nr:EAL domain-containing protein [Candidatus Sulfurimonas baltica]QOY51163.1 EAL domain-containing protein [Candidatus Sulfurimonas baltica]